MSFKKNDVITYRGGPDWCRHHIAVILGGDGWGYARDTYWGIGDVYSDSGWLREQDVISPRLIGNIDDFEPNKYLDPRYYRDEDKFWIPVGGGSEQNWFRKNAQPDPALIYARLVYQVEKSERAMLSAQSSRDYAVRELNKHIAEHGIPDNGKEVADAVL